MSPVKGTDTKTAVIEHLELLLSGKIKKLAINYAAAPWEDHARQRHQVDDFTQSLALQGNSG